MPSRYRGIMGGAMPGEERQILGFFERANDPNVLPRPFEDYRRSIELGLFYTVKVDDQLIAAAGVFPLHEHKISPMEMGSCFVAPVARNFGIQKLLIRPRIAASILYLRHENLHGSQTQQYSFEQINPECRFRASHGAGSTADRALRSM
jgi:hypothetical protein